MSTSISTKLKLNPHASSLVLQEEDSVISAASAHIFGDMLQESFKKHMNLEGQVVKGTVVSFDGDMALIDVSLKSEGRVPLKEFPMALNVGDFVDVYIDRYEGPQGDVQISHERARQEVSWQYLVQAYKERLPVDGVIMSQVKGGLIVDIQGTSAFLPGSQVDIRPVKDLNNFLHTTQQFLILKMDDSRNNVVVSRRAMLEVARASEKQALLANLEQGQILEGVVKNLTDYGAFVDLGGIDGLLHNTDISWKRTQDPSEVLQVGQVVRLMVTRFNKETQRISLGMKQLEKDPWVNINERYKEGDRIRGTVTNVTDYGAFVEMDEGLEGLVYVGEMMWCRHNVDPKSVVQVGQAIDAMILEIDTTKRRISLGMKQCTENPLLVFSKAHPVGSTVHGTVKDVTEFGLLVHLPGDIDGTVHVMDLSWTMGMEALEHYNPGQSIAMKVLSINAEKEIIGLGVKQLERDPWVQYCGQLKKGDSVEGTVASFSDGGADISLAEGVTIFVPRQDLGGGPLTMSQTVKARVSDINHDTRTLTLAVEH